MSAETVTSAAMGHRISVSASISVQNQSEIWARIWMHAKETRVGLD